MTERIPVFNRIVYLIILFTVITGELIFAQNKYPIILVHGFMGWGREEMGNYRYWGGKIDLEQYLKDEGYTVFTASVGPVSSNWDRAVELYYQIKGGQVDYGKAHSELFGLVRKPESKNYTGLYPEWDEEHPAHFVGHSMGGQTVRMLDYLLKTSILDSLGNKEESEYLGEANEGWVSSITSISAPHNGTTLSDIVTTSIPFLQDFIAVGAVVGSSFYNFDLEQWGFSRDDEESWGDYFRRMRDHPSWGTKNMVAWDVSVEGAKQMNTVCTANPDIYYFSFVTGNTIMDSTSGRHVPDKNMSFIIRANARFMGMKKAFYADGSATDSTWFENDGIVNKVSMYGPTTGTNGPDPIAIYRENELLIPGQWYVMGEHKLDHRKFIGHSLKESELDSMKLLFSKHMALLWTLPK
ncbi:MAG: lipase [Candidatus Marinimicrobia bacterium]|nr:lipase [Candidatus Neomarinimicrobiota bacterium]